MRFFILMCVVLTKGVLFRLCWILLDIWRQGKLLLSIQLSSATCIKVKCIVANCICFKAKNSEVWVAQCKFTLVKISSVHEWEWLVLYFFPGWWNPPAYWRIYILWNSKSSPSHSLLQLKHILWNYEISVFIFLCFF